MNISNIALVRATNIIPFSGIVYPVSEVPYIKKNAGTDFALKLLYLLREEGIAPSGNQRITQELVDETNRVLKQYIPYVSDYNSMVLWAINGLVPDDSEAGFANNTFSDKKCVIIDGLKEQMEMSEVVSLKPTDTAIKGKVKLSESAIIMIEEEKYKSLSEKEKEQLQNLNLTVKTFSGDLRKAVEETLHDTGRYIPERPSLSSADGGFFKSETSEEVKKVISDIAEEKGILQLFHMDILFSPYKNRFGGLKDELENINTVYKYSNKQFYDFLIKKMNLDEKKFKSLYEEYASDYFLTELCSKIKEFGLDNYKQLVDEYNSVIENLQEEGKLPTGQQIVDMVNKEREEEEIDY